MVLFGHGGVGTSSPNIVAARTADRAIGSGRVGDHLPLAFQAGISPAIPVSAACQRP